MLKDTKVFRFFEQVKQEAYKVVWSDRRELIVSATVVLLTVLVVSVICLVLDYSIHSVVHMLLSIGK